MSMDQGFYEIDNIYGSRNNIYAYCHILAVYLRPEGKHALLQVIADYSNASLSNTIRTDAKNDSPLKIALFSLV